MRSIKQNYENYLQFDLLLKNEYLGVEEAKLTEEKKKELKNDILNKKLPWLIAAGTGELHNGPKRFQEVLGKLIINSNESHIEVAAPWFPKATQEDHADVIRAVFADTRPGKDAFARYLTSLDNFRDKKIDLTDRRRENLLADYNATDRIVEINRRFELLEKELGCRYIVLYLSSDQKSHILAREILDSSPRLYGRPINLIKNAAQLWLEFWLCSKVQSGESTDETKQTNFESIENLLLFYNTISQGIPFTDPRIVERTKQLQDRMQRFGLIKNATYISEKLKRAFAELIKNSTFGPLREALKELNGILENTSAKEGLLQFQKELRAFSIQLTIFHKLRTVLNFEPTPDISSLGYVVGINHHLPTLFLKTGTKSVYEELIDRTVMVILSPGKSDQYTLELKTLSADMDTMMTTEEAMDVMDANVNEEWPSLIAYYERQTLLYLFSLLLPVTNLNTLTPVTNGGPQIRSVNLDYEMNSLLEYDIKAMVKLIDTKDSAKTGKEAQKYREILKKIVSNLYYIQVWSFRRNSKMPECTLALENFSTFSSQYLGNEEDIRILHGKALLSYTCLLILMDEQHIDSISFSQPDEQLKKVWKKAQKEIERAIQAYELGNSQEFMAIPFAKAESALVNTLIYVNVIGYAISKENGRLVAARELLNDKRPSFEEDRRKNPEYMHTEANLEFFEAYLNLSKDRAQAKLKIDHALEAVTNAGQIHRKLFPHKIEDKDYTELRAAILDFRRNNFENQHAQIID